jgi:hypothetical protein
MKLDVLIPNSKINKTMSNIASGSAIVAGPFVEGVRRVYFQGNIHGAVNLHEFEDRLLVAGYRLKDRAPTKAFTIEFEHDRVFEKVGTFDLSSRNLQTLNENALDSWVERYESSKVV